MSNQSVPAPRYCELCQRDEKCHCPQLRAWCEQCVPTRRIAFDFRVELNEECPPELIERAIEIGKGRTRDPGAAYLRAVG